MPKFKPKVIWDANLDFQINPDMHFCRICPKMLWMHYYVGSFRQVWYKLTVDCMRNANKMSKNSPFLCREENENWSGIYTQTRITTKSQSLLDCHPLPMPAKFGRRLYPRLSVVLSCLQNDRQNDHITSALLAEVTRHSESANSTEAAALSRRAQLHSWREARWRPLLSENISYKAPCVQC